MGNGNANCGQGREGSKLSHFLGQPLWTNYKQAILHVLNTSALLCNITLINVMEVLPASVAVLLQSLPER